MKALYVSAASIALAYGLSAKADDTADAADVANAPADEVVWSESSTESSILSQAKAVFAAVRQRAGVPADGAPVPVVDVGASLVASNAASLDEPAADCERMEFPGSRIRGLRCYAPSEGERALNDYQFQEELRQMREQQAIAVMQRSQLERVTLEAQTQPQNTGGLR